MGPEFPRASLSQALGFLWVPLPWTLGSLRPLGSSGSIPMSLGFPWGSPPIGIWVPKGSPAVGSLDSHGFPFHGPSGSKGFPSYKAWVPRAHLPWALGFLGSQNLQWIYGVHPPMVPCGFPEGMFT